MPIIPYGYQHANWVLSNFGAIAGYPTEVLSDILANPDTKACIRVGREDPSRFLAYAVLSAPQTVAFAYTKPMARGRGYMTSLLKHLGVDLDQPLVALFRTPATDGMIRRGWRVSYPPEISAWLP